jgi:hypothetical protein
LPPPEQWPRSIDWLTVLRCGENGLRCHGRRATDGKMFRLHLHDRGGGNAIGSGGDEDGAEKQKVVLNVVSDDGSVTTHDDWGHADNTMIQVRTPIKLSADSPDKTIN